TSLWFPPGDGEPEGRESGVDEREAERVVAERKDRHRERERQPGAGRQRRQRAGEERESGPPPGGVEGQRGPGPGGEEHRGRGWGEPRGRRARGEPREAPLPRPAALPGCGCAQSRGQPRGGRSPFRIGGKGAVDERDELPRQVRSLAREGGRSGLDAAGRLEERAAPERMA